VNLLVDFGLEGSCDWSSDKQVRARKTVTDPGDRAILLQSEENVEWLANKFPSCRERLKERSFGENVRVTGDNFQPHLMCVGDIYKIVRKDTQEVCGRLQVTSPRWPCYKMDMNLARGVLEDYELKKKQGEAIQGICAGTGRAGVFLKVLNGGSLRIGDSLELVERPCPEWTLERLSQLFYGGENQIICQLKTWQGTKEELEACRKLTYLSVFEWRDRLERYVEKSAEREKENEKKLDGSELNMVNVEMNREAQRVELNNTLISSSQMIESKLVFFACIVGILLALTLPEILPRN